MKIFKSIIETQSYSKSNQVGFVPTMGALHQGHISLVKRAKDENEKSVCSIFVNPTQFNNPEDLSKYPRTLEADLEKLEKSGCDAVFVPEPEEIYPEEVKLSFNFGRLEEVLEGKFRPGHFNGVGIVVSKLFNIIKPSRAYFGLKDLQQCAVINRLVKDLSFSLELILCDTVREGDGLAMSSRNMRLSNSDRQKAPFLYQTLIKGKESIMAGQDIPGILAEIHEAYQLHPSFQLEYYEVVDFESLESIHSYNPQQKTAIVVAAHLGGVRLIDNILF